MCCHPSCIVVVVRNTCTSFEEYRTRIVCRPRSLGANNGVVSDTVGVHASHAHHLPRGNTKLHFHLMVSFALRLLWLAFVCPSADNLPCTLQRCNRKRHFGDGEPQEEQESCTDMVDLASRVGPRVVCCPSLPKHLTVDSELTGCLPPILASLGFGLIPEFW